MQHKYIPGVASDKCQFRVSSTESCLRPASEHEDEDTFQVGDIVEDSYANPAIVLAVRDGKPTTIRQLVGSDRGRVTYASRFVVRVTGERAEWAKQVAAAL